MEDRLRACPGPASAADDGAAAGRPSSTASPTASSATSGTRREIEVRRVRKARGVDAVFKLVDTCAAEFEAFTPYYYSTYETPGSRCSVASGEWRSPQPRSVCIEDETRPPAGKDRIMILGGGPNRIGQGIEFDYCCCQAAFALRRPASRPSWSTRTRRRSPPTTTPATICSSSR